MCQQPTGRDRAMLFFQLHRAKGRAIQAGLAQAGLQDVGQPRILMLLHEEQKDGYLPTQWELAQRLRVSPATIANSLKSLERMGYIRKQGDLRDGRKKRVAMTEKGRQARQACMAIFREVEERMYAGFSPEELARLDESFDRMLRNLAPEGMNLPPLSE